MAVVLRGGGGGNIVLLLDVSEAIERVQTDIPHVVASNSFTYQEWQEMASMAEELELSNKKSYAYRL